MYNDNEYAVLYNNTEMKFPKNPVPDDSPTFEGWYDEKGNRYDGNSTTQTDLTLYAKIVATGTDNLKTKDKISINNNKIDINSESEIGDITIWNIHGTKVINKTIRETTTELDINSLQNGIYLFKSKKDCIKFTKK